MKLVELLAKELKEWPEGVDVYAQDDNGQIYPWVGIPQLDEEEWLGAVGATIHQGYSWFGGEGMTLCEDHMTANVTKSQWQAEREKMNKPKWIRHRGGKCPVPAGAKVSTRHRDGKVVDVHFHTATTNSGAATMNAIWKHTGDAHDIMSYKVISQPSSKAEARAPFGGDPVVEYAFGALVEDMASLDWKPLGHGRISDIEFDDVTTEEVDVKDTTIGTLSYKVEIDATEATKEIDSLVAKWGQIESPLKWRDAIIHCQAIIEDCEREIQRNVNLLDAEGLMMQKDSKKAMQHYAPDVDMSDWRNWQAGDVIEIVGNEGGHEFENGEEVIVVFLDLNDIEMSVKAEYKDGSDYWWLSGKDAKFVCRP